VEFPAFAVALDADFDQAGNFLEAQHAVAVASEPGQDPAGADIGMAGKRHLAGAVEDADARGVGRILRRHDEGRLAEIELRGQGLHFTVGQTAGVGEHRQRVAAETPIGEDVDGHNE